MDIITNRSGYKKIFAALLSAIIVFSVMMQQMPVLAATATDSFSFRNSSGSANEYMIYSYKGTESSVTLPAEYNGTKVTEIDDWAFYKKSFSSLTIPSTYKSMGEHAIYHCDNLETVIFDEGCQIETISVQAFGWCTALKEMVLPDSVKRIEDGAFYNCKSMTSIAIPRSVEYIDINAFSFCKAVLNVYEGSYAHTWADENNKPYNLIGVDTTMYVPTSEWKSIPSSLLASLNPAEYTKDADYNTNAHTHTWNWANPSRAALSFDAIHNVYMRVKALDIYSWNEAARTDLYATYYDGKFNYLGQKKIPSELPVYGGFYETEDNYYIVTGQHNEQESDDVEVIRVTKYDKAWNRLGAAAVRGCNTWYTLDCNSVDITNIGGALIVRTGHEMYKSSDGLHHQACLTVEINTADMSVTSKDGLVSSANKYGYVSHSFNQLIDNDGENIVMVDHGDAYPRSLVMTIQPASVYKNEIKIGAPSTRVNLIEFPGGTGANRTGATVGGLLATDFAYITVGTSIVQDDDYANRNTKNVFMSVYDKGAKNAELIWLTKNSEGNQSAQTPYIVRVGKDANVVIWGFGDKVYYQNVNDRGQLISPVREINGYLSDCEPIVVGGLVVWFIDDGEITKFYTINPYATDGNSSGTTAASSDKIARADRSGAGANCSWRFAEGKAFWYENGTRQGTVNDAHGVVGDGTIRGREIFDPESDGWYWLDSIYDGAKACGKEVWVPYIFQEDKDWSEEEIVSHANGSGDMKQQVIDAIHGGTGKWVRYDAAGKMVKGWYTVDGIEASFYPSQAGNTYFYDYQTGLMAKGWITIDGTDYHFDETTGALQ